MIGTRKTRIPLIHRGCHKFIYPLELIFTATLLALVPYFILRGPVNRIARRFIGRGTETSAKDAER
jgi:hypothetical protein